MKYRGFRALVGRFGVTDSRNKKRLIVKSKWIVIAVAVAGATLWFSPNANALSSFARQTGLSCGTCHWSFPELTPFGREFKLNAYTTTAEQNLKEAGSTKTAELSLAQFFPLSASVFTSLTYTRLSQPNSQNPSVEVPQALDLWLAGQVLSHFGEAVQITYAASSDHFSFDSSDVRYANETTLFGEDLVYGIDSNNSPTFEDVWNSTPAYGFPYMAVPDSAGFTPMATTLIDGALARRVIGGGLYAMFADHLYVLAEIYRSQYLGEPQPETGLPPSPATYQAINIQYVAPYWRLAWQQDVGKKQLL
jgi:hypothetical protein